MDQENAVIERDEEQLDTSSDDLRSALTSAFAEVNERARDEQGRFSTKTETPAPVEKTAPAKTAPVETTTEIAAEPVAKATETAAPAAETPQVQPQNTIAKPPDSWSPAAKAKFATLDPDVQAEIARREAEVHKGFTKQDEHRNLGKTFESTVAPYLPMIKAEGSDPVKAAAALLQSAYTLRAGTPDQKEQLLIGLMGQYQIDPNRVFQRLQGGQQAQAQVDPQVQALTQQVQQLQQRLMQGDQQTEQVAQAQINTTIEAFASDPKNIYFANVKPEMAALMREGRAKDLQEAYDMACWARPDIRPLLLQQQEQQRQAEARARTQKARAAGSTVTGSPSGSVSAASATSSGNLADDLRSVYREVMSRE